MLVLRALPQDTLEQKRRSRADLNPNQPVVVVMPHAGSGWPTGPYLLALDARTR